MAQTWVNYGAAMGVTGGWSAGGKHCGCLGYISFSYFPFWNAIHVPTRSGWIGSQL